MAPQAKPITFGGIYAIRHIGSGKMYVGSATDFHRRWRAHRNDLRRGTHHSGRLQNAWNKYGSGAFVFEILEVLDREDILILSEQAYLDAFETWKPAVGYNISPTAGSCLGVKHRPEVLARRAALRGRKRPPRSAEYRAKLSAAKKGKKQSEELRAKRAASQTGKKRGPQSVEHRAKLSASRKANKNFRQLMETLWATRNPKRRRPDRKQMVFDFQAQSDDSR